MALGLPWLRTHNPSVDWITREVLFTSDYCRSRCFCATPPPTLAAPVLVSPDHSDCANIPSCYHDLKEVFNKTKACSLPPHRSYDCAIDLLPGAFLPRGRLYSLSAPETQAMKEYIQSSLQAGIIRPSSSPAGAGFFFVAKKDKSFQH